MAAKIVFPPLNEERREKVDTATAAFHVNRKPRTLRDVWAAGKGPLQPVRVNGRLAWDVDAIRKLLRGSA